MPRLTIARPLRRTTQGNSCAEFQNYHWIFDRNQVAVARFILSSIAVMLITQLANHGLKLAR